MHLNEILEVVVVALDLFQLNIYLSLNKFEKNSKFQVGCVNYLLKLPKISALDLGISNTFVLAFGFLLYKVIN